MITPRETFSGYCDNCGKMYQDDHSGFSIFTDRSSAHEYMDNDGWYTGHSDPDHEGKDYCDECFKHHPDEDDKIILDTSRMSSDEPNPERSVATKLP